MKRKRSINSKKFENELQKVQLRKSNNYLDTMRAFSIILSSVSVWVIEDIFIRLIFALVFLLEGGIYCKSKKDSSSQKQQFSTKFFLVYRVYIELVSCSSLRLALVSAGPSGFSFIFFFSIVTEVLLNSGFPSCSKLVLPCIIANFLIWQGLSLLIHKELVLANLATHLVLSFIPYSLHGIQAQKAQETFQEFYRKTKDAEKVYRVQENITFPMFIVNLEDNYQITWANIEGRELQRKCGKVKTFPQLFFGEYEFIIQQALQKVEMLLPKINSIIFPLKVKKDKKASVNHSLNPDSQIEISRSTINKSQGISISDISMEDSLGVEYPEMTCQLVVKLVKENFKSRILVTLVDVTPVNETIDIVRGIYEKNKEFLSDLALENLISFSKGSAFSLSSEGMSLFHKTEKSKMASEILGETLKFEVAFQDSSPTNQDSFTQFNIQEAALQVFLSLANPEIVPPGRLYCFDFIDDFSESVSGLSEPLEQILFLLVRTLVQEGETEKLYCQILRDNNFSNNYSPTSINSFGGSIDEIKEIAFSAIEMTPQLANFPQKPSLNHINQARGLAETIRFEIVTPITEKVGSQLFSTQTESHERLLAEYFRTGREVDLLRLNKTNLSKLLTQINGKLSVKKNTRKNLLLITLRATFKLANSSPNVSPRGKSKFSFVNKGNKAFENPQLIMAEMGMTVLWKQSRRNTHVLKIDTMEPDSGHLVQTATISDLSTFFHLNGLEGKDQRASSGKIKKEHQTNGTNSIKAQISSKKSGKETPFARGALKPIKRMNLDRFFQKNRIESVNGMPVVMENTALEEIASMGSTFDGKRKRDTSPENSNLNSQQLSSSSIPDSTENNSMNNQKPKPKGTSDKKTTNLMSHLRSLESPPQVSNLNKNYPSLKSTTMSSFNPEKKHVEFLSSRTLPKKTTTVKRKQVRTYSKDEWNKEQILESLFLKSYIESITESVFSKVRLKDCLPETSKQAQNYMLGGQMNKFNSFNFAGASSRRLKNNLKHTSIVIS